MNRIPDSVLQKAWRAAMEAAYQADLVRYGEVKRMTENQLRKSWKESQRIGSRAFADRIAPYILRAAGKE